MKVSGRKLKLTGPVRLQAIKQEISNYPRQILTVLAREKRVSLKLVTKLKEIESIEKRFMVQKEAKYSRVDAPIKVFTRNRKVICYSCQREGHIASKCPNRNKIEVNAIEKADAVNLDESSSIFFFKWSVVPILILARKIIMSNYKKT
ncbi:hypothetical protein ENBRE01_2141 [Enteropsectra breve]|nr:hypothetical protein ENBRE01_2141 [Enteropsectra breve]